MLYKGTSCSSVLKATWFVHGTPIPFVKTTRTVAKELSKGWQIGSVVWLKDLVYNISDVVLNTCQRTSRLLHASLPAILGLHAKMQAKSKWRCNHIKWVLNHHIKSVRVIFFGTTSIAKKTPSTVTYGVKPYWSCKAQNWLSPKESQDMVRGDFCTVIRPKNINMNTHMDRKQVWQINIFYGMLTKGLRRISSYMKQDWQFRNRG